MLSKYSVSRFEAEDIVQEVFIKLYLQYDSGATVQFPKTWLYKIASNICINTVSRHKETLYIQKVNELDLDVFESPEMKIEEDKSYEIGEI